MVRHKPMIDEEHDMHTFRALTVSCSHLLLCCFSSGSNECISLVHHQNVIEELVCLSFLMLEMGDGQQHMHAILIIVQYTWNLFWTYLPLSQLFCKDVCEIPISATVALHKELLVWALHAHCAISVVIVGAVLWEASTLSSHLSLMAFTLSCSSASYDSQCFSHIINCPQVHMFETYTNSWSIASQYVGTCNHCMHVTFLGKSTVVLVVVLKIQRISDNPWLFNLKFVCLLWVE
jgi:hypothetical protein